MVCALNISQNKTNHPTINEDDSYVVMLEPYCERLLNDEDTEKFVEHIVNKCITDESQQFWIKIQILLNREYYDNYHSEELLSRLNYETFANDDIFTSYSYCHANNSLFLATLRSEHNFFDVFVLTKDKMIEYIHNLLVDGWPVTIVYPNTSFDIRNHPDRAYFFC